MTMKNNKIQIKLCMGSSCYSRGNDTIKVMVQEFLQENNLMEEVDFRGHLCKALCNCGPNLSIGAREYKSVSESNILLILKEVFRGKLQLTLKETTTPIS